MIKHFFILLCFICVAKIVIGQIKQTEGMVTLQSAIDPPSHRQYVWFKDSAVIFEIFLNYSESMNDSLISEGVCLRNYSFLDLKTMHAQDYLNFSDTARPVTNYLVKEDESVSWNFYRKTQPYDKFVDSLKLLPDTTLDDLQFKRVYFDVSGEGWHQQVIYYLLLTPVENIFHLSYAIEKRYPGYKVKYVQYKDCNTGLSSFSKLIFIKDRLNLAESKIFNQWNLNIKTSTLPLTSLLDAQKRMADFSE